MALDPAPVPPVAHRPVILIVGGGYVGLYTALRLQKKLARGRAEIVVVDPQPHMTYQPFLPEAAAGSVEPRHVVVPLRPTLRHCRVITGVLTGLQHAERRARIAPVEGTPFELSYDVVVMAAGSVARTLPIPGLAEFGIGFKTVGEAIYLRNHVLARLDAASSTDDPAVRKRALTFTFVGGGYAGVGRRAARGTTVSPVPVRRRRERDRSSPPGRQVHALCIDFLDSWSRRSGAGVAAGFADDGDIIGFEGSHHSGRLSIASDLRRIFGGSQTAADIGLIRSVRPISDRVAGCTRRPARSRRAATTSTGAALRARAGHGLGGPPLEDRAVPGHTCGLEGAPRGPGGADPGAAQGARAAVSVLVRASQLLAAADLPAQLDVRWALGDDRGRERYLAGHLPVPSSLT